MRLEVRTVRRGGKEFLDCPLCRGRVFTAGNELRAHLKRHHNTSVQWTHATDQAEDGEAEPDVESAQDGSGESDASEE